MDYSHYTLVNKDGKSYLRLDDFDDVDMPVHLNEYGTLVEAQDVYSKLERCESGIDHIAPLYPVFQMGGKILPYIAAVERGTSLQSFLTPENVEKLFDINALTQRPYQASSRYMDIVRSLLIAGRRLAREGLMCSFNLNTIFLMENYDEVYVEVTDFFSGEGSQLWRGLYQFLCDINSRNAHYMVDNDSEMTEVLNLLQVLSNPGLVERSRYEDKLLKSTFFWSWVKKENFIEKMGQLFKLKCFKPFCVGACRYSFPTNWIERVRSDRELDKLFVVYRKIIEKEFDVGSLFERQFHPIDFIRCTFSHYHVMRRKIVEDTCEEFGIEDHIALYKRFEWCLGQYVHRLFHRLVSDLVPLEDFPYDLFGSLLKPRIPRIPRF
ncbi:hypothetical protein PTKIN_Ptkin01aG0325700 [Pterospermum kingtungense]